MEMNSGRKLEFEGKLTHNMKTFYNIVDNEDGLCY